MNKINFQNGTLVSKAKVTVGGTVYEVEPAEYEGTTPLNAENLNQIQTNVENAIPPVVDNLTSTSATDALSANQGRILNEKTQRHIITAKGGSSETATTSSENKLIMATATTVGNKLTLTNDGGIKIGSGVTKVAISASTTYTGGDASQHTLLIYKNSKANENRLARVLFNSSSNIQTTISIPYQIISVSENDILYLFASSSVDKRVSGPMSYMTVEVIE